MCSFEFEKHVLYFQIQISNLRNTENNIFDSLIFLNLFIFNFLIKSKLSNFQNASVFFLRASLKNLAASAENFFTESWIFPRTWTTHKLEVYVFFIFDLLLIRQISAICQVMLCRRQYEKRKHFSSSRFSRSSRCRKLKRIKMHYESAAL